MPSARDHDGVLVDRSHTWSPTRIRTSGAQDDRCASEPGKVPLCNSGEARHRSILCTTTPAHTQTAATTPSSSVTLTTSSSSSNDGSSGGATLTPRPHRVEEDRPMLRRSRPSPHKGGAGAGPPQPALPPLVHGSRSADATPPAVSSHPSHGLPPLGDPSAVEGRGDTPGLPPRALQSDRDALPETSAAVTITSTTSPTAALPPGQTLGGGGEQRGGRCARPESGRRTHRDHHHEHHRHRHRGYVNPTGGPVTNSSITLPVPRDAEEPAAIFAAAGRGSVQKAVARRSELALTDGAATRHARTHDRATTSAVEVTTTTPPTIPAANTNQTVEHPSREADEANDGRVCVPYQIDVETFDVPLTCPDDSDHGAERYWYPGKPLRVAYVTWNMAKKKPRMGEVAAFCVHPNAHLVVVGTQENGPYIGTNRTQRRWVRDIGEHCLGGLYTLVETEHMWAIHIAVFARTRDVAQYVSHVDHSKVSAGLLGGAGGNKGGVAVALALSMVPQPIRDPGSHRSIHGTCPGGGTTCAEAPPPLTSVEVCLPNAAQGCLSLTQISTRTVVPSHYSPQAAAANDRAEVDGEGRVARPLSSHTEKSFLSDDGRVARRDTDGGAAAPMLSAGLYGPYPAATAQAAAAAGDDMASDAFSTPEAAALPGGPVPGEGAASAVDAPTSGAGAVVGSANGEERGGGGAGAGSGSRAVSREGRGHAHHHRGRSRRDHHHHHDRRHRQHERRRSRRGRHRGTSASRRRLYATECEAPSSSFLTILCLTAHLAAHQGAVRKRNRDYCKIVRRLEVGYRGKHRAFFKSLFQHKRRTYGPNRSSEDEEEAAPAAAAAAASVATVADGQSYPAMPRAHEFGSRYGADLDLAAATAAPARAAPARPPQRRARGQVGAGAEERVYSDSDSDLSYAYDSHSDEDDDEDGDMDVATLELPPLTGGRGERTGNHRDVTEEFDVTLFGGDLNYRIDGTRKAIEYIVHHHKNIRSILINNDQLTLERSRGTVFHGFKEGALFFRPTYKYELSAGGGVTLDEYNFSHKSNRLPSYCDRVLYKLRRGSTVRRATIRLYTDVPNVRTSDHRPVVAIFDIATRAYVEQQ